VPLFPIFPILLYCLFGLIWLAGALVAAALLVTRRYRVRSLNFLVVATSSFLGSCGLSMALISAIDIAGYGPWWGADFGIVLWLASLVPGAVGGAMIGARQRDAWKNAYRFSQVVIQRRLRSIRSR
jgi:hypothetical protein